MDQKYDTIIVGGGPAGLMMGLLLSRKGIKTAVADRASQSEVLSRLSTAVLDEEILDVLDLKLPQTGEEVIARRTNGGRYGFPGWDGNRNGTRRVVVRYGAMIRRILEEYLSTGGEVFWDAECVGVLFENGALGGIAAEIRGETKRLPAKLVIDASGLTSCVRRAIPRGYGIDNTYAPRETRVFLVHKHRFWEQKAKKPDFGPLSLGFPGYYEPLESGVAALAGFLGKTETEALGQYDQFVEEGLLEGSREFRTDSGALPFGPPPGSLTGRGYLTLGSAAGIFDHGAGRGISESWRLCREALDPVLHVLRNPEPPQLQNLWVINQRWFRGRGADNAAFLMLAPAFAGLNESEREFLDLWWKDYPLEGGDPSVILGWTKSDLGKRLFSAGFSSGFRLSKSRKIRRAIRRARKIREIYHNYPDDPTQLGTWEARTAGLWKAHRRLVKKAF